MKKIPGFEDDEMEIIEMFLEQNKSIRESYKSYLG